MAHHKSLEKPEEVERCANQIVTDFLHSFAIDERPDVHLFFSEKTAPQQKWQTEDSMPPIRARVNKGTHELVVCPEILVPIPHIALQGWLELQITTSLVKTRADWGQFNFRSQILPLMRLAASSLYFVRGLVEYLSRSLIRLETTRMIRRMDRALPQVYYYFFTIAPSDGEKRLYRRSLPHNWSRAGFLCSALVEYMGLSYLAGHGIGFSRALKEDWQHQYDYLHEDQVFLDEMFSVACQSMDQGFATRLTAMFKVLRNNLLIPDNSRRHGPGQKAEQ